MAKKGENITTRFVVDVSEFKKGIKEAQRLIKEANFEFKEASARMGDWEKSTTGLQAKVTQLSNILEALNKKLANQRSQYEALRKGQKENANNADILRAKIDSLGENVDKSSKEYVKLITNLNLCEKQMAKDEKEADKLEDAIRATKIEIAKTGTELKKYNAELKESESVHGELEHIIEREEADLNVLKKRYQDLVLTNKNNTKEATALKKEIESLSAKLLSHKDALQDAKNAAEELDAGYEKVEEDTKSFKDAIGSLQVTFGNLIADGIRKSIDALVDMSREIFNVGMAYESALADVSKTTNATGRELEVLSDGFRELSQSIPQSAEAIAETAAEAAQLGVSQSYLIDFTETMMRLGDATNLTSEEAAEAIARIYNMSGALGDYDDVENFASALVDLGNNSATTEAEILDLATRMASASYTVGLTQQELLALATTLSSVGLRAEAGGSAISQVMVAIDQAVAGDKESMEKWAAVAGMTAEEFQRSWGTETMNVLQAVIHGLSNTTDETGVLSKMLNELGIETIRQTDTMRRLAFASELLDENIVRSNKAWSDNEALLLESERRYETTESQLQLMKNSFADVALSIYEDASPAINTILTDLRNLAPQLLDVFTGVNTMKGDFAGALTILVDDLVSAINDYLPLIGQALGVIIGEVVRGIATGFPQIISGIMSLVSELLLRIVDSLPILVDGIMTSLPIIIDAVTALIPPLIRAILSAIPQIVDAVLSNLSQTLRSIIELVNVIIGMIPEIIPMLVDVVVEIINSIAENADILSTLMTLPMQLAPAILKVIPQLIPVLLNELINLFDGVFKGLYNFIVNYISSYFDITQAVSSQALNALKTVFPLVLGELENFFTEIWNRQKTSLIPIINFVADLFATIVNDFKELGNAILQTASDMWEGLTEWWNKLREDASNLVTRLKEDWSIGFDYIKTVVINSVVALKDGAMNKLNELKSKGQTIFNNIVSTAVNAGVNVREGFVNALNSLKNRAVDIFTSIKNAIKTPINGIIGMINGMIDGLTGGLNGAIDFLNGLGTLEIPDWVPAIGGQSFSFNLSRITPRHVPYLEKGGVLRRGQVGLLEGNGAEAVVPLDQNYKWIKAVAEEMTGALRKADVGGVTTTNTTTTNNFTQNIYTPTAPSRREIYRDTKNLLDLVGG